MPSKKKRALEQALADTETVGVETTNDSAFAEPVTTEAFARVPLDLIDRDPLINPRKSFDAEDLAELTASIAARGVLQPILIRPNAAAPGRFLLVGGERRFRSAKAAELADIPAAIRAMTDAEAQEVSLIENLQRADLTPMEEARRFREILDTRKAADEGLSEADAKKALAVTISKSTRFIEYRLTLLQLSDADQKKVDDGELTIEAARKKVANQPKPIELTDAAWLMLLEIHKAAEARAAGEEKTAEVRVQAAACRADPTWAEIKALGWNYINGPSIEYDNEGYSTGLEYIATGWQTLAALRAHFGDAFDEPRAAPWSTPWLNGPFEVDPERLAEIEAAKATDKARRDREVEESAARLEAGKARTERERQFLGEVMAFQDKAARGQITSADFQSAFEALLASRGGPGPWSVVADDRRDCRLSDAQGGDTAAMTTEGVEAFRRVIAIALNFAAGLPPTSGPALPEPDADDDAFDDDVRLAGGDDDADAEVDGADFLGNEDATEGDELPPGRDQFMQDIMTVGAEGDETPEEPVEV